MGALAVAMATEDNERDAQYKLSLAQSFDQEPRKEDPQETLTSGLRESSINRWMGSIPSSYSNGREGKGKEEKRKRLDVAAEKGNSFLSLSLSLSLAVATLLSLPSDNARLGLRRKPNFRAEREERRR
jgi:hypothetical protein